MRLQDGGSKSQAEKTAKACPATIKEDHIMEKYKVKYCLTAVVILLFTINGFAAVFNVSPSADSNCNDYGCNFQAALNACLSNNGTDNEIHLLQGEYRGNFYYHPSVGNNGDITIIGGYFDNFNQQFPDRA